MLLRDWMSFCRNENTLDCSFFHSWQRLELSECSSVRQLYMEILRMIFVTSSYLDVALGTGAQRTCNPCSNVLLPAGSTVLWLHLQCCSRSQGLRTLSSALLTFIIYSWMSLTDLQESFIVNCWLWPRNVSSNINVLGTGYWVLILVFF